MKNLILLVFVFTAVFSCDSKCSSLCSYLNGNDLCYTNCGCLGQKQEKISLEEKSEFTALIKLSSGCDYDKVQSCSYSAEYYKCLENVGCLVAAEGFKLLSSVHPKLWKAAEPHSLITTKIPINLYCEECDDYYDEEYEECAFWNCRQEIIEFSQNLKNYKEVDELRICKNFEKNDEFVSCIWFY